MSNPRYPIEKLKKWHDGVIETAKKILREDGELRPIALFLAEKMSIDQDLQEGSWLLSRTDNEVTNLVNADEVKPADTVVLVVDLVLSPDQVLAVLKSYMSAEHAAFIDSLETTGRKAYGVKDPAVGMSKILMDHFGISIKDVVSMAIQSVIKKTDAIAYVKVDEAWLVSARKNDSDAVTKFSDENGSIQTHPDAKEAIMTFLETTDFVRMVSVPFRRNRPKTGRVIGFDEPMEITETPENRDSEKISGRFAHLFDKAKAQPKPPTPTDVN